MAESSRAPWVFGAGERLLFGFVDRTMTDLPTSRPPVTLLSGFLGAGKTTLLNHLVAQAEGRRLALVVNDVASINVDAQLVANQPAAGNQRIVQLGRGCVCCSIREELAETVAELGATGNYDHVLIEGSGVAEPQGVARLFTQKNAFGRSLGDFARLHALVTVVDAADFLRRWDARAEPPEKSWDVRPMFELIAGQIECADVLVLNKCDLVSEAEAARAETILAGLNARAEILRAEQGQLPVELLLDRPRFDPVDTPRGARWMRLLDDAAGMRPAGGWAVRPAAAAEARHERDFGIASTVFAARRPFRRAELERAVRALAPRLLRAKGFFWCVEEPDHIGFLSVAGGEVRFDFAGKWAAALRESGAISAGEIPPAARARWAEPHGDRRQELAFIGVNLDEPGLREALTRALKAD